MLANADQAAKCVTAIVPVAAAAVGLEHWAHPLFGLCVAALSVFAAIWLFRKYLSEATGRDPKEILMNLGIFKSSSHRPQASGNPRPYQGSSRPNPTDHHDVRSRSVQESRSGGDALQPEELRALLREIVREELSKHRNDMLAELQGSLRAITERIDAMQIAQKTPGREATSIERPSLTLETRVPPRAATESEVISFWRTLRGPNQVSAARMKDLATSAGCSLAEAPGLAASDPLHRLGFLLTDGQGTVWFIPRPVCQRSELQGVYTFPANSYLPGAISDVTRFARWQNGQIVAPGEAQ